MQLPEMQLLPETEADGYVAEPPGRLPGHLPLLPPRGAELAPAARVAPPGSMPPPPPRTMASRGVQAPPSTGHLPLQAGARSTGGSAGGLGDFDVTIEAPAAGKPVAAITAATRAEHPP
jgi:hypothetical protein